MARRFTAGAEFGGVLTDSDYDSLSGTTISWDTGTVRSGGFAWKFLSAASSPFLTRQYTSSANDTYARAYINVAAMTTASSISIFVIRDATNGNNVNIRLTRVDASHFTLALWDEQAALQIGSSTGNLNINQWYRVEFSYVNATGAIAGYVDGTQFASGTGTASLGSNTLRWGSIDASTMTIFFDDIAVNDQTAGGTQTGLPGVGAVVRAKPNAAGDVNTFATQTGGTAGAANAFSRLSESPPDDATTFDGSSTLNQEDLVKVDVSGVPSTATINVVEVWARFRNSTADATAAIKFEIEKAAAGTVAQSAAIVPNSTTWKMNALAVPKTPPLVLYQDPSSANWNPATWAPQVGYKLTTGPGTAGRRVDVTSISAIIDFLTTTTSTSTTTTSTSTSTTTSSSTSSSTTTTSTSSSTTSSTSSSTTTTSTSSSTSSSTTTTSTSSSSSTTHTTTSTSSSSSTSITTSTTTTLALLETLIDPWDTIDPLRWQDFSSGNAVADGQLHFTSATNTIIWALDTVHNYDMRNSHVTHQLVSTGAATSQYWTPLILEVYDSGNNFNNFEYFVENGRLTAQTQTDVGGVDFTDIAYDAATMQYFRIRETNGTIFYEYSARGDTWTTLRSEPTPFDVSSVYVELSAYSGDNVSRTLILDNLNILTTTSTSSSTTTTSTSSSTTTSTSSSTTTTSTSSSTSITTSTSTTHTTTSTTTTSTSTSSTTTTTSTSSSTTLTHTTTSTSSSTSITTSTTQTMDLRFNIGPLPIENLEESFTNSLPGYE